ncbi:MAG: hypothetical protein J5J00_07340, partial [Deltaproteobacteria bacterium]|nr:hypothetical protein [Deltaproteobacteria bacterium]
MAQLFFRAGRIALYTAGALVTLALALYFILRIPYIAQKFLLPRLAAALNIEISAENVRLDPLSSLELSGVTLSHQGSDFAEFEELTLDYNPRALFNRVFEVSSLQVKGLAFNSEYDAGVGWKNLPAYKTPDEAAPPSAWSTKVLRVRVSDSSASVKVVQHHGGAVQYIAESINLSGAFLGPNLSPSVSATAENVRTISEKREVSAKRIELLMNSDLDGWSPSEWSALLSTSEVSAALPGGNVPPSSFVFSSNGYREGDTWKLARASLEQSPGLPGEHLEVKLEGDYEIKGATGKFRAEISNADLRILNLAAIQTSKPPVIANGSARGEIAGSFDTEAERIRMFGNLEIKNLDLKPNEISGVDIRLEPQVTLAFEDSKIKWEPSDLTAFRDGSELLSSSSSGQFDFASAQGAALFEVNLLHTTLINELANQEIVPEAQISGSVNMSISEDGLRWAAQNVRGLANGQTILRGETQGTIALQEGGLQLEANIEEITDEALSRAVEAALPDFQASGQLRLNYQKPNIAAATDLKFTSLELPYTEGVDLKGSSVVKFQKSGPLIKLASAKIDFTTQEDEPVIDASAEGTINLESERKSDLLIDASFIDADKLLPQPESESQPPARNAEDHDGPMQQSPALPIAEPQIAIDKLKYR